MPMKIEMQLHKLPMIIRNIQINSILETIHNRINGQALVLEILIVQRRISQLLLLLMEIIMDSEHLFLYF